MRARPVCTRGQKTREGAASAVRHRHDHRHRGQTSETQELFDADKRPGEKCGLGLTAFETVFRNACESVNWVLDPPGSATRRFVDLEVTPKRGSVRRLSLKSTAAQIVSASTAHISKLTEAAWIQDARTPKDRQSRLQKLFADYHRAVDSIVMLRVFRRDGIPHRYQLIEIPTSLFSSIQDAPLEAFHSDAPIVSCEVDGETAAVVAVDRSDAKVAIRRIRLTNCVVHAEWTKT